MALSDFFRINLPYGIEKNSSGEWFAFNREYKPIGWNTLEKIDYADYPIASKYKLSDKKLMEIASLETMVEKNEKGEIIRVWLYKDGSMPLNNKDNWDAYCNKLKILSTIKIK